MELFQLRELHASMRANNLESTKFIYDVRAGVSFDVFFNVSVSPYELIFGLRGTKPEVIFINVYPGYKIDTILDGKQYKLLASILRIDNSSFSPFSFKEFMQRFSLHIPNKAQRHVYHELTKYLTKRNDIDESMKIFFLGFRANPIGNFVSDKNHKKNCFSFGQQVADSLKKRNISTCWTPDQAKSKDFQHEYDSI